MAAKTSPEIVKAVKQALLDHETWDTICAKYHVSNSTISHIKRTQTVAVPGSGSYLLDRHPTTTNNVSPTVLLSSDDLDYLATRGIRADVWAKLKRLAQ